MQHKIVTITGGDLTGKETQCAILCKLITRQYGACTNFSFPRYDRPFGKLMGAMLDEQDFRMSPIGGIAATKGRGVVAFSGPKPLRNGDWYGSVSKKGKGSVFQFLCAADKYDAQEEIGTALNIGHVVCDRYDSEMLVYGVTDFDGKEELALSMMEGLKYRSDIVIVLWNSRGCFSRAGEIPDLNERNRAFQERTFQNYKLYAREYGWHILDIADLVCDDMLTSVCQVTKEVVRLVNESGLALDVTPADWRLVKSVLEAKGTLPTGYPTVPMSRQEAAVIYH